MLDPLAKETARLEWHNSLSYLKKFLRQFDFIMIDFIIVCKYSSLSNCKGAGGANQLLLWEDCQVLLKRGTGLFLGIFPNFHILPHPLRIRHRGI